MIRGTGGFSMVEITLVCFIASALIGAGVRSGGEVLDKMSVNSSRSALIALHARAIERGTVTRLFVDPAGDSAWVSNGSVVVERVDFAASHGTDIVADERFVLCMAPNGIADTECNSFDSSLSVQFSRGGENKELTFCLLGQVMVGT
jgi:hypothetical protein